ncbi:hypothetical protein YPPY103_4671, partial [Yersinia pestis PY-103]
MSINNIIRIK